MSIQSINPVNGELIQKYKEMSPKEVEDILKESEKAWQPWLERSFSKRANLMKKMAEELIKEKKAYARIITEEMGKNITSAEEEIEKCAWVCDYYATHAEKFLEPILIKTSGSKSYVTFQPLGTILAIMPWNYPFWQVFRFAVPTLMAGNTVVLKHASNVSGSALLIEKIFQKVGFPPNIFRTLLLGSQRVNEIIGHPTIKAVTFTGSTLAGRAVAAKAGSVLKKVVLELGGSDPYIILEDAHIENAIIASASSRFKNAGQSCIAAKRLIVVESQVKPFTERFLIHTKNYQLGDPMNRSNQIGPLARKDLRDHIHQQVEKSIQKGAKCLLGGKIPTQENFSKGAYYPPTILVNVKKGMAAYEEEIFGPVAVIITAKDEKDAIAIANDTSFGLAGAIFSKDVAKAEKIAREEIQTGSCFVNHQAYSDPRLPFGGIKNSGYGRELSHFGIREFVNIKTIYIN